jgi:RNA-binding protein YlmH
VRHTDLILSRTEAPSEALFKTEVRRVQIQSERLDAVIARVYSLSREDAQLLFARRLVFASGREISSVAYTPKTDEVISVRGHGRMIYLGYETTSKKGKLNIEVEVYV